jgi:hypothetical protein
LLLVASTGAGAKDFRLFCNWQLYKINVLYNLGELKQEKSLNYVVLGLLMGFLPLKVNIWLKSALLTLSAMLSTFYLNYGIIYFIKNIINYFNNYFLN